MGRSDPGNGVGPAVLRPPDADAASYPGAFIAEKSAQYGRAQAAGLRTTVPFHAISDNHERRDPEEFHDDRTVGCGGETEIGEDKIAGCLNTIKGVRDRSLSEDRIHQLFFGQFA